MPTIASLSQLNNIYSKLKHLICLHEDFFMKLKKILEYTNNEGYRFRVPCKMIIDEQEKHQESSFTYQCCILQEISQQVQINREKKRRVIYTYLMNLRKTNFYEYNVFADFLRDNRAVGFDNICRMILGETPEQVYIYGKYTTRKKYEE